MEKKKQSESVYADNREETVYRIDGKIKKMSEIMQERLEKRDIRVKSNIQSECRRDKEGTVRLGNGKKTKRRYDKEI